MRIDPRGDRWMTLHERRDLADGLGGREVGGGEAGAEHVHLGVVEEGVGGGFGLGVE